MSLLPLQHPRLLTSHHGEIRAGLVPDAAEGYQGWRSSCRLTFIGLVSACDWHSPDLAVDSTPIVSVSLSIVLKGVHGLER